MSPKAEITEAKLEDAVKSLLRWKTEPEKYPFVIGAVLPVLDAYLAGQRKKKKKNATYRPELDEIAARLFGEARSLDRWAPDDRNTPRLVRTAGMLRFYATRLEEISEAQESPCTPPTSSPSLTEPA
jgi:hypothetical protein